MSCPFCEAFNSYERQLGRRLDSGSFAMSEENAHLLMHMAAQIRSVARTTLRRVGNEAVPTMLCDLLDGLAEGLMEGLDGKLAPLSGANGDPTRSPAKRPSADRERAVCQDPERG